MIKKILPLLTLPCLSYAELPGEFTDLQFTFGYKQNSNPSTITDEPYEHKVFAEARGSYYYLNEYEGPGVDYDLRIYSELNEISEEETPSFNFRDLTFNYKGSNYTLSAGRQTITWSETFGLNIMDIVNPRDYSYAFFDDIEWSKKPVWLATSKFFGENWFVELLLNPYGESNTLATKGSEFDAYRETNFGRGDADDHKFEYGTRANYLFKSGLDLSLIYYRHMNRNPYYYLGTDFVLKQNTEMVDSFGTTFSFSTDSWVFRGDVLYNSDNPVAKGPLGTENKDWMQSIVGADYSGIDRLILAVQVMTDSLKSQEWVALQFRKEIDSFEMATMAVIGLDNSDIWIRPELKWTGYENLTLKGRFDYLYGKGNEGMIGVFKENKRITLELSYLY
ncbi:MAG: hypothetical protein KAG61_11840 [Bacteriovoracaceae bacterium]|nr:hypothetical protein [Bacteriovoracaceae bacterium]